MKYVGKLNANSEKMKFNDIRRIQQPIYTINMCWSFLKEWIEEHKYLNLNLDPDYQRDYVWTQKQKEQYIEWILREGQSGKIIYWNCPGWMRDFRGPMEIVDGKQRLNAVLEFLDNKVKAYGCYFDEYEVGLPMHAEFIFSIGNFKSRKEILQWYVDMNTGGTAHTENEITKVMSLIDDCKKEG